MIESNGEDEYRFTQEGLKKAIEAYEMHLDGKSAVEINDTLGLGGDSIEAKEINVKVLLAMAELTGAIAGWEEFKELDARLEEVYDEETS